MDLENRDVLVEIKGGGESCKQDRLHEKKIQFSIKGKNYKKHKDTNIQKQNS